QKTAKASKHLTLIQRMKGTDYTDGELARAVLACGAEAETQDQAQCQAPPNLCP
ncbi:MAG: hypothetical protein JWQ55_1391, partial [Rhodopila sp.]|nr:hypothetical protein [Rhodopila sp.]